MSLSEQNRALIDRFMDSHAVYILISRFTTEEVNTLLDAARQEGAAERDGGGGVPVRSLSVQATDKSDRAEGVAALQHAAVEGKEEHVWQRGGKRWTPPLHWQEIYDAITEYAAKPDHMYTEVERMFATHAIDLADAVAGALSGERTYTQAEVDSILRAAFPLKTPDERAALSRSPLPQQTALVEESPADGE